MRSLHNGRIDSMAERIKRLPQADSAELEAENGRVSNTFDDSASTLWHTAYTNNKPTPRTN
jgi:hypothetical protein